MRKTQRAPNLKQEKNLCRGQCPALRQLPPFPCPPLPHPTPPFGAAAGHEPAFARSVPVQPQKETEQPHQHFPRLTMELGLPSFPSVTPDPQRSRCSGQAWPLWPQ